jgi:hypothetical protein
MNYCEVQTDVLIHYHIDFLEYGVLLKSPGTFFNNQLVSKGQYACLNSKLIND